MNKIQVIEKQPFVFQYEKEQYEFVKPYYLKPKDEFRLIKAKVKGSTMGWQFGNNFISYNEIKKEYEMSTLPNKV